MGNSRTNIIVQLSHLLIFVSYDRDSKLVTAISASSEKGEVHEFSALVDYFRKYNSKIYSFIPDIQGPKLTSNIDNERIYTLHTLPQDNI